MDDSRFDQLARAFSALRTRRSAVMAITGSLVSPVLAVSGAEAKGKSKKKKKKKCATKCATGCCTSKYGKCIQPDQQSVTRCGSGGGICRTTGCPVCTASRPCPAGQCCQGDGTCGNCLVFISSSPQPGNLQGLVGADAICQNLAGGAGLPGTYLAWLSDSSTSPSTRFTKATVPYTLVDGTVLAASWNALVSSGVSQPINRTETGAPAGSPDLVWSNTLGNGSAGGFTPGATCTNWTSSASATQGNIGGGNLAANWTRLASWSCDASWRLYCFQQR